MISRPAAAPSARWPRRATRGGAGVVADHRFGAFRFGASRFGCPRSACPHSSSSARDLECANRRRSQGFHCFAPALRQIRNRPAPGHGCRPRPARLASEDARSHSTRVLVAGGGVAGLETVLALQALAGERSRSSCSRPNATSRTGRWRWPSRSARRVHRFPLAAIAADRGVRVAPRRARACAARPTAVETQGGARLAYDALVLALGARPVEAVRGAITFRGPQDVGRVAELVAGCATARCTAWRSSSRRHDVGAAAVRARAPDRRGRARVRGARRAHGRDAGAQRRWRPSARRRGRPWAGAGRARRGAAHRRGGRR